MSDRLSSSLGTYALGFVIVIHALIHVMGFAKAFGLAQLEALREPISRPLGVVWLLACLLFLASAVLLLAASRWWWLSAAPAIVLSQIAIMNSFSDAKWGTLANIIVLVPLLLAIFDLARRRQELPQRAVVHAFA